MKLIAVQGVRRFLVSISENKARIIDLHQGKFFPEFPLDSILARGYWHRWKGTQRVLPDLLNRVGYKTKKSIDYKYLCFQVDRKKSEKFWTGLTALIADFKNALFFDELDLSNSVYIMLEVPVDSYKDIRRRISKIDSFSLVKGV